MNTLVKEIKTLAEQQVICKNQRKTINLEGDRTMTPNEAIYKHEDNRYQLRHMYAALGVMRGRDLETVDQNHADLDMNLVNKLVVKHLIPKDANTICNNS